MKSLPANLHAPLKLFVKELESHVEFFQNCLDPSSTGPSEENRKKVEGRLHLIKGSAGFFKLDKIRDVAQAAEKSFKEAKGNLDQIRQLFQINLPEILTVFKAELRAVQDEVQTL